MRHWFLGNSILALATIFALAVQAQEPKEKSADGPPKASARPQRGADQPDDERPQPGVRGGKRGKADDRGPMPPGAPYPPGGPGRPGEPGFQPPFPPGIGPGGPANPEALRAAAENFVRRLDRNENGKLEASEWGGPRGTPDDAQGRPKVDANDDGEITVDELLAHPHLLGPMTMRGGIAKGAGSGATFGMSYGGGFGGSSSSGGGGFGGSSGGGGFGGYGGPGQPPPDDPQMRELMKQDADLDRQAMELSHQIRRAPTEEREKLKAQLSETVNKHFDVRQKRRELQLTRLKEELERLQSAISKRNDSRDAIVKNRVAELVGEPRDLEF